jgi:hypothetical protein
MTSARYDILYFQAGVDQLKDFLLVDDLFWPIGISAPFGEPPYPRLTVGGLLLSRERLIARRLPLDLESQFGKSFSSMQSITSEWRNAWENKAARSFHMRLNMWRDFLEEYRKEPEVHANRYVYEVRLRVMLHLLELETNGIGSAYLEMLSALDKVVKALMVNGDFICEAELRMDFPRIYIGTCMVSYEKIYRLNSHKFFINK